MPRVEMSQGPIVIDRAKDDVSLEQNGRVEMERNEQVQEKV